MLHVAKSIILWRSYHFMVALHIFSLNDIEMVLFLFHNGVVLCTLCCYLQKKTRMPPLPSNPHSLKVECFEFGFLLLTPSISCYYVAIAM